MHSAGTGEVTKVWACELVTIPTRGRTVKPLRPSASVSVGQWEPGDARIEFPEPFRIQIV